MFELGNFANKDIIGLRYYSPPISQLLFDCSFKGQQSFSNLFNLTCRYIVQLSAILNSGEIWLAAI